MKAPVEHVRFNPATKFCPHFSTMEHEPWFKIKRYPHIGLPITVKDYSWVNDYVCDSEKIRKHSFLPLLHKNIVTRKFRVDDNRKEKTPTGKRFRKKLSNKERKIYYSSHLDSLIFSKYNEILSVQYEKLLRGKEYNECVVAYRKIPRVDDAKGNKSNIEFAKSAFEFITERKASELSVIIADFSSFFDNLSHKTLKSQWSRVLGRTTLPPDHYNIFKALTKRRYVIGGQLFQAYGNTMIVKRGVDNDSTGYRYVRKKIKNTKFFKEKDAVAYCEKDEFLKNNVNLIITDSAGKGIPQGSPISATLANVYMIDFDEAIFKEVSNINGFYQRYSDDLIIICERKYESTILSKLFEKIELIKPVELSVNKTKLYHFQEKSGIYVGYEVNLKTKVANLNKSLEYLGFAFDGSRVLLKTAGISKFYRNMKSSFNRRTSFAMHTKNPDKKIFKSKLYKRFTYLGAKRRLIYLKKVGQENSQVKTTKFDWGNYISYLNKAEAEMRSINGESKCIKRQSRKFWKKFHTLMRASEEKITLHHQKTVVPDVPQGIRNIK